MLHVMVIDMSEGFTRTGPLASPRVDALVPRQAEFLRRLPHGSLIIFANDEHDPADFELQRFPPHCLRGSREAEIRPELLAAARECGARVEIVRKHTFSAFHETGLDQLLADLSQKPNPPAARADPLDNHWIVIGCVTDCCVEANVAELVYRGRRVTVIRDLIDTWDFSPQDLNSTAAKSAGLTAAHLHPADAINDHWFNHRFSAIWGVRVVNHWRDAITSPLPPQMPLPHP